MIDLRGVTQKQSMLEVGEQKIINDFMRNVEEHINLIAPAWPSLSQNRKDKLLAHSPILAWVVNIAERVK